MATPVLDFIDVAKTFRARLNPYRTVVALRGVSFGMQPGEALALLGPNRAGKTTLLKILLGLCRPSSGAVFRLGRPLSDRSTLARVGYMHENQAFPRYLSAAALLDFYGRLSGLSPSVLKFRIPALLEKLQLADRAREPIDQFSKGMVQRLALAHSIIAEPDLLVLDEPMEGLDLSARLLLQEIITQQRHAGKSVIVVSHTLGEIAQVCDRLVVLVEGRLACLGSVASLLQDPDTLEERSLEAALAPIYRS
jgi:ABC-2 type transport system ATP-binding protein